MKKQNGFDIIERRLEQMEKTNKVLTKAKFQMGDIVRIPSKRRSGTVVAVRFTRGCWQYFVGGHFYKESQMVAL